MSVDIEPGLPELAAHFLAVDPLLPEPSRERRGRTLGAVSADGRPLLATWSERTLAPGSQQAMWSALHTVELHPMVGKGADLGPLLTRWRMLLAERVDVGADSACVVTWPSRDVAASRALLDHGLVPLTVLAVRTGDSPVRRRAQVSIRNAEAADLPAVLRLALWELEYAASVGAAVLRPGAEELKAEALARWVASGAQTLVAESDGEILGMVQYRWSQTRASDAPLVRPGRWGYVHCLSVRPDARERGVGAALIEAMHRHLALLDVGDVCLYYNPANPLSSVFWPRQGYRPLWTIWETRPLFALR